MTLSELSNLAKYSMTRTYRDVPPVRIPSIALRIALAHTST